MKKNNIISDWLDKYGDPEIDKKVEIELERITKKKYNMNKLDKDYTDLLQDILDNGVKKETRNGSTISVFGRQIRHSMKDGKFPLITTKKMYFKGIVTELLWILRGDTNIKYLVDNDCHIWDGDAWKNYQNKASKEDFLKDGVLRYDDFINKIKTDDEFAKKFGELGPIYGSGWRNFEGVDQISELIDGLKTNPDSRRLRVSAWQPHKLKDMVLPPCHTDFQVYTRELSLEERLDLFKVDSIDRTESYSKWLDDNGYPTRAISLMWSQRSCDTFLGLPFNIASYGLLLEIIAKSVNMVPDELIGNLGDTHLYSNHIEQAKEQIGRELDKIERINYGVDVLGYESLLDYGHSQNEDELITKLCDEWGVPKRTREPYPLPTLNINTEFWPYEGGSCGEGPLDAIKVFESFSDDNFCRCLLEEDIQLGNYQSHPSIKAPLSN